MAFSGDGKCLATGSRDNAVILIELKSKTIYHRFDNIHSGTNYTIYNYLLNIYGASEGKKT